MGIIKTKAIILRESNMGDFDKMLTMLTPDLRKNFLCSKRSKKTEFQYASWYSVFEFWRICSI